MQAASLRRRGTTPVLLRWFKAWLEVVSGMLSGMRGNMNVEGVVPSLCAIGVWSIDEFQSNHMTLLYYCRVHFLERVRNRFHDTIVGLIYMQQCRQLRLGAELVRILLIPGLLHVRSHAICCFLSLTSMPRHKGFESQSKYRCRPGHLGNWLLQPWCAMLIIEHRLLCSLRLSPIDLEHDTT